MNQCPSAPTLKRVPIFSLNIIEALFTFSFFSVRSVLVLYLTQDRLMEPLEALSLYAGLMSLGYSLPLLGGWVAGKYVSARTCTIISLMLLWLGITLLSAPNFMLDWIFGDQAPDFLYHGLTCLILGAGLFRPLIPLILGDYYALHPEKRESGFRYLYAAMNVGNMLGPLVCSIAKIYYGWSAGFLLGSFGCLAAIALVLRYVHSSQQTHQNFTRRNTGFFIGFITILASAIYLLLSSPEVLAEIYPLLLLASLAIFPFLYFKAQKDNPGNRKSVLKAFSFVLYMSVFVMLLEQTGGSFSLFIDQRIDLTLWEDIVIPASIFQVLNPLFVVTIVAIMSLRGTKEKILTDQQMAQKTGFGFLLTALGFGLLLACATLSPMGEKINPLWVVAAFLFLTLGELKIIPQTLTALTRYAPPQLRGIFVGLWPMAVSYGHYLAGLLVRLAPNGLMDETGCVSASSGTLNIEGVFTLGLMLAVAVGIGVLVGSWIGSRRRSNNS